MGDAPNDEKPRDPFEAWRGVRDAGMNAWAKAMVETVNSDEYAKATGVLLDASLSASAPFREALEKAMTKALQQLSMPTRDDFVSLAERLTNIEMRLDDMDAKLDRLAQPPPASPRTPGKRSKAKKEPTQL
jgi:polyhydroxyalkanoic acid synthase PhaR subunit